MTEKKSNALVQVIEPNETTTLYAQTAHLHDVVIHLENCGGDLDSFCRSFHDNLPFAIFCIEKRLLEHPDMSLKERWDKAIDLFHVTRMRLLQRDAVRKLEQLDSSDDKKSRVDLAFAKLILGDLLSASAAAARQKATNKTERSSALDNIKDVMEQEEDDNA